MSVTVSRPLSSTGRRVSTRDETRGKVEIGASSGGNLTRPRTAGASRHCDVDATCGDVARRWIAAAESIDIVSDYDLAQVRILSVHAVLLK
jgi:hypothetical protein